MAPASSVALGRRRNPVPLLCGASCRHRCCFGGWSHPLPSPLLLRWLVAPPSSPGCRSRSPSPPRSYVAASPQRRERRAPIHRPNAGGRVPPPPPPPSVLSRGILGSWPPPRPPPPQPPTVGSGCTRCAASKAPPFASGSTSHRSAAPSLSLGRAWIHGGRQARLCPVGGHGWFYRGRSAQAPGFSLTASCGFALAALVADRGAGGPPWEVLQLLRSEPRHRPLFPRTAASTAINSYIARASARCRSWLVLQLRPSAFCTLVARDVPRLRLLHPRFAWSSRPLGGLLPSGLKLLFLVSVRLPTPPYRRGRSLWQAQPPVQVCSVTRSLLRVAFVSASWLGQPVPTTDRPSC
jgi:hypothetical protein